MEKYDSLSFQVMDDGWVVVFLMLKNGVELTRSFPEGYSLEHMAEETRLGGAETSAY